jgi:hypothetical protein
VASNFKINKQGVRRMMRDLEKEVAKNPIRVPVQVDPAYPVVSSAAATVNNYHGPVVTVNGDHAQIAWGNENVTQKQARTEEITPGFEDLARQVTDLLANLATYNLGDEDADEVKTNAKTVLGEVVRDEPDRGVIRKSLVAIKGQLAPVLAGVGQVVTEESAEAARDMIEALSTAQF